MSIRNFNDAYENIVSPEGWLTPFISGHLVIEYLLRKASKAFSDLSEGIDRGLGELFSANSIDDVEM